MAKKKKESLIIPAVVIVILIAFFLLADQQFSIFTTGNSVTTGFNADNRITNIGKEQWHTTPPDLICDPFQEPMIVGEPRHCWQTKITYNDGQHFIPYNVERDIDDYLEYKWVGEGRLTQEDIGWLFGKDNDNWAITGTFNLKNYEFLKPQTITQKDVVAITDEQNLKIAIQNDYVDFDAILRADVKHVLLDQDNEIITKNIQLNQGDNVIEVKLPSDTLGKKEVEMQLFVIVAGETLRTDIRIDTEYDVSFQSSSENTKGVNDLRVVKRIATYLLGITIFILLFIWARRRKQN